MVRYDLAFFLCCCKSFLGDDPKAEDFYALLGVDRDATQDEIKRAYKRQSLQMHPDKLAQKGKVVTVEDQSRFTRMKEAYEVLADPHKRESYDAIGERGMKWLDEPFSLDPQELAHNFATSSVVDRSKIFGIFVGLAVAVFWLPFMICLQVDQVFGPDAKWTAVLVPLWIGNAIVLFYHSRVIMMGPIQKPDHIPAAEWVDPLPMKKRIFSLIRFLLLVLFEILAALKLDKTIPVPWFVVFSPLYLWEATTIHKKIPLASMKIVTVEDLETALGKPFTEFTSVEKDLIGKKYSVVPSIASPEYEAAQKIKVRARHDIIKSGFRVALFMLLLVHLDGGFDWNWWLIFMPFWLMTVLFCWSNYQAFAEVQQMAMEKDPALFGPNKNGDGSAFYGSMGNDGTPIAATTLTDEEREELKAQVMASSSKLCSKCCSQGFLLVIVLLFVGKIQGAGYSAILIISPLLLVAGIILCCIGCAIFGITEVLTDGVEFDTKDFADDAELQYSQTSPSKPSYNYVPPSERPPSPVVLPTQSKTLSIPTGATQLEQVDTSQTNPIDLNSGDPEVPPSEKPSMVGDVGPVPFARVPESGLNELD